jgi:serine/threonine protein phosphatase PrpC
MTEIVCHTDQGPRENLEDAARAVVLREMFPEESETVIAVVADGVGGHRGGEVASALAAQVIVATLCSLATTWRSKEASDPAPDSVLDALTMALGRANAVVTETATANPYLSGMGTTAVCAVATGRLLFLGWAGDSRGYLYRHGKLRLLTRDHREIQPLIDLGLISPDQAQDHPLAHTITRHVGQGHDFEPETRIVPLAPGDVLLFCTDGLTDVLSDERISETITEHLGDNRSFVQVAEALVRQALAAGTRDNVTALCCTYDPGRLCRFDLQRTVCGSYGSELARTLHYLRKGDKTRDSNTN